MWIRRKTYNNLKKNLYNRGVLLKEAIADSAELSEMASEKDAEIAETKGEVGKIRQNEGRERQVYGQGGVCT